MRHVWRCITHWVRHDEDKVVERRRGLSGSIKVPSRKKKAVWLLQG